MVSSSRTAALSGETRRRGDAEKRNSHTLLYTCVCCIVFAVAAVAVVALDVGGAIDRGVVGGVVEMACS